MTDRIDAAAGPVARAPATARAAAALAALAAGLAGLTGWRRAAAAWTLGAAATLALPPVGAVPVLLVVFPMFVWLLDGVRSRAGAFAAGWLFGFGYFLIGLYWVAVAFTVDLERFFWLLPISATALPALLALFPALAVLAYARLPVSGVGRPVAFALAWALAEWLRGHVLTGFPWNLVGYAWVDWLPVVQSVSVIGIYGLSLLTAVVAALPAAVIRRDGGWSRAGLACTAAGLALFGAIAAAGTVRLAGADTAFVPDVQLRLVQPNIRQADKWDPDQWAAHFDLHRRLSIAPGAAAVTHVIWPETAVPYRLGQDAAARRAIAAVTPPGGVALIGAPRSAAPDDPVQYWNSLFAIDARGEVLAVYDKFHLVPFGEYVPLRGWLPLERVAPGRVDFSAGPGPRTLYLPGAPPFSPLICYEAIFPGAVTAPADGDGARPAWLLNVTNDAWYGETAGPHQHFAIARTRAVEQGLPLVRVATTGISGVVDAYGRVTARLGLGERGVIDAPLPVAADGATLYARWGDSAFWLVWACLGAAILILRHQPKILA